MKVEAFTYKFEDELAANTYIAIDDSNKCIIIDPSVDYDGIVLFIKKNKLKPKAILLTHGHFDHIRGVDRLVSTYKIPLYCHYLDNDLLYDTNKNCSGDYYEQIILKSKALLVKDNDLINVFGDTIKVIHTPYHTEGSVCYLLVNSNILFSGDSLFKLTVGRDDLPNSVPSEKANSLKKIMTLNDDIKVYPGHGNSTNLGYERTFNRFINR